MHGGLRIQTMLATVCEPKLKFPEFTSLPLQISDL